MALTQVHRHLAFSSPLGKDALLLTRMRGDEGISRLFRFELELLSENPALDFNAIIGKNATVRIDRPDHTDRYINGVVSRFAQSGTVASVKGTLTAYHVEMVPWLWLLTRTADCKIFQRKTVVDIIKAVFATYGFGKVRYNLQGTYPELEYCVQYRETDFNFVSRLMEQFGIFYFFEHANGAHTLVLGDANAVFQPCPGQAKVRFQTTIGATRTDKDVITGFTREQEMRSAKYSLMDFNFKTPPLNLQVNVDSVLPPPAGMKFELYDYPGEYLVKDVGEKLATSRIEEEETQTILTHGAGNCRSFVSGYKFDLIEHPRGDINRTYILTSIEHAATEAYEAGDLEGGFSYSNHFSCMPLTVRYRAARVTPKPMIHGLQTAIVAGVEEIYTDKFGRIKVQFHWDRFGKRNEDSSCWIRVAQNWAGKRWGFVFLPRKGMEVVVAFLEGDPDQPLVVGCVYNADQMPPYELPDKKTRGVMRSNTSTGGGRCNEIQFEDKAGKEELYVHAGRTLSIHVKEGRNETVEGDRSLEVKGDRIESLEKNTYRKVAQDDASEIGQDLSRKVGSNMILDIGGSHSEQAGQEIYLKAGMKVVIEAGLELTLKAAGGFVKIDPSGVYIQGNLVMINSGGAAGTASAKTTKSIPKTITVIPPTPGSPDWNVFTPSNVPSPSDGSGSTSVTPGETEER